MNLEGLAKVPAAGPGPLQGTSHPCRVPVLVHQDGLPALKHMDMEEAGPSQGTGGSNGRDQGAQPELTPRGGWGRRGCGSDAGRVPGVG